MKKLLSFLTLIMIMSMVPVSSWAQYVTLVGRDNDMHKRYLVLESGKTYSSSNTDSSIKLFEQGSITYDESTKTLTLNNAIIQGEFEIADLSLNIVVNGQCKIKPRFTDDAINTYFGISMSSQGQQQELTISGDKLEINALLDKTNEDSKAIYLRNTKLTVACNDLFVQGTYGIYCTPDNSCDLVVDESRVLAGGSHKDDYYYPALSNFNSITYKNSYVYNDELQYGLFEGIKTFYLKENGVKHKADIVVIDPGKVELFNSKLMSGTYDKWNLSYIKSGEITYDSRTSTLTLENVNADTDGWDFINVDNHDLKIILKGTNNIVAGRLVYASGKEQHTLDIEGAEKGQSNKLISTCTEYGMYFKNTTATISNCTLSLIGKYGISGYENGRNSENTDLIIDNAYVSVTGSYNGSHYGSIQDLRSLTLKNCHLTNNDYFTAYDGTGVYDGKVGVYVKGGDGKSHIVSDEVRIIPNGVQIIKGNTYQTLTSGRTRASDSEGLESGTIYYDPDNGTLTLDNATLTGYINVFGGPMDIILNGDNYISGEIAAIWAEATSDLHIYSKDGKGTLTTRTTGWGIYGKTEKDNITISNCTLDLGGENNSRGIYMYHGKLTIDGALVKVFGKDGCVQEYSELELKDCSITSPDGAASYRHSDGTCSIRVGSNLVMNEYVVFTPTQYPLKVAGEQVTMRNRTDILGDGKVSYNPDNNTLSLANGTIIEATGAPAIEAEDNINIEMRGTATVKTTDANPTIVLKGTQSTFCRAEGAEDAVLNINGGTSYAIDARNAMQVNIDNCTMNVSYQGTFGIYGSGIRTSLRIEGANVSVSGRPGSIPMMNFKSVELKYVNVTSPSGATYDATNYCFVDKDGNGVRRIIEIAPIQYDIVVAGTQVTGANCNDILGDGTVSYNPESNTLMLENAQIWPDNAIDEGIKVNQDLTIFVKGGNSVGSTGSAAIWVSQNKNVTIIGGDNPELYTVSTSTGDFGFGIYCLQGSSLSVKSCYIKAIGVKGSAWGKEASLDLYASVISAYTMNGDIYPVYGFTNESLTDAEITYPAGGTWTSFEGRKFVLDASGNSVLSHVIIGQDKRESTIGILAELVEVLNGRKTGTYAYEYTGDGKIDLDDVRYVSDDILETETTGTAIANINGTPTEVQWVQLWAGGPKWAVMNVGAQKDSDYGKYFNFGENPKEPDYLWYGDDSDEFQGTDWDIAKNHWGGNWVMPRHDDYERMIGRCTFRWTNNYKSTGKSGYIVTGKDKYAGNSIFFPAAGTADRNNVVYDWNNNAYWTSTRVQGMVDGFALEFTSSKYHTNYFDLDIDQRFPVRAILSY